MVRWGQDSIQLLKAESDSSVSSSGSPTAKPSTAVRRPRFYRSRPVTNTSTHPFLVKEHIGTIFSLACIIVLLVWIILLTVVSTKLYEKVFEVQELTNRTTDITSPSYDFTAILYLPLCLEATPPWNHIMICKHLVCLRT
ncbi:hypothetical protein GE061_000631 [Apolygus lucorum]|uniref:Uncharacterized protein n=1 Tax=Apolygus lucorum TaxID=248454 RepID=A0A8S9Y6S3_APOLU|nr:hypothetical protein GE061_000631 [Apolygus lucorum]